MRLIAFKSTWVIFKPQRNKNVLLYSAISKTTPPHQVYILPIQKSRIVWQGESVRKIRESLSYKTQTIPPLDDPTLPHEERTCPLEWDPRNADVPANGGSRTGAGNFGRPEKTSCPLHPPFSFLSCSFSCS
ncbi:hypothetical protein NPIL_557071 [Nephila pilipes]|uniref:Uncharacterized protein n=1 Tax=Nephila pilipes TaxID=299642 RepID=A0A8X6PC36_NEPPI|nr:hypothetical protein NPIL_557071 [Nephila pilipes]